MSVINVPVLIVGGGGCGLALSAFLSDHGIDHLLVERHRETSRLPKAHYLNQRTMEIFRQHGLAEAIAEDSAPLEKFGKVRWQTTLAGDGPLSAKLIHEMDGFGGGALRAVYTADGPVLATNLPQLRLEPILYRHAAKRAPGRILFGSELAGFADQGGQVSAEVRDAGTGESTTVLARYLVAADGGKTIGPALGIEMRGMAGLADVTTAHFSADLSRWWHDGTLITWFINPYRPDLSGAALVEMGPTWGARSEEWGLHFAFAPDDPARFDEAAIVPRIREILGLPDLELTLHQVSHWMIEGILADRYRSGRVLLVGDAAHRNPPATGLGLNTGIQDAHNLAWKLAAVLRGQASDDLLNSYEAERRPVGEFNVGWSMATSAHHQVIMDAALGLGAHIPPGARVPMFFAYFDPSPLGDAVRARATEIFRTHRAECQAHDIEIGFAYEQGAIIADGTQPPRRSPLRDVHQPTTRPGHLLPHAWVEGGNGERISTQDLVGHETTFALVTGPDTTAWCQAAAKVSEELAITIRPARIGVGGEWTPTDGRWLDVREMSDSGALLVRPDNHVAWRCQDGAERPVEVLRSALEVILGR